MAETPLPHRPVLLAEALAALAIRPDGFYVDATFGRGGHAAAILERLGSAGSLLALDRDPAAGEWARSEFGQDARFRFVQTRFSQLADMIEERGLLGRVNGVLLDLGVSSPQLDDPARGFSFIMVPGGGPNLRFFIICLSSGRSGPPKGGPFASRMSPSGLPISSRNRIILSLPISFAR